jgi:hypothetical protein
MGISKRGRIRECLGALVAAACLVSQSAAFVPPAALLSRSSGGHAIRAASAVDEAVKAKEELGVRTFRILEKIGQVSLIHCHDVSASL